MKISIIIPTLGRTQELIDTVQALAQGQTRKPDEILVIDQNQPQSSAIYEAMALLAPQGVRHIHSTRTGVTYHMNWGIKEAKGDFLLFVDDDVIPEPTLVEKHVEKYEAAPAPTGTLGSKGVVGVAGRVYQPQGDLPPRQIKEVGAVHRVSGVVIANFNGERKGDVDFGPGGNMSYRRDALLRAGGIDEGFEGNAYFFEPDLGLRVKALGGEIIFAPDAALKHLMAPAGGCRMTDKAEHTYYFIRNGIRLYRRHGVRWGMPLFVARMVIYALAKALYNRQPRIALRGFRALQDGLTQNMDVRSEGLKGAEGAR